MPESWQQTSRVRCEMATLLTKVKSNLILTHDADDELIQRLIDAAVAYAESYQHLTAETYQVAGMPPTTEAAVQTKPNHSARSGRARHISPSNGCGGMGKKLDSMKEKAASQRSAWRWAALASIH